MTRMSILDYFSYSQNSCKNENGHVGCDIVDLKDIASQCFILRISTTPGMPTLL